MGSRTASRSAHSSGIRGPRRPPEDPEADQLRREVERLRAENAEANRELAELREAVATRDAFLRAAGHELRNAMGSILVATTNLRFDADHQVTPAWVATRLELITRQSRGVVRRATTLLDVSRLSTGSLRLDLGAVAWAEIVHATVADLELEAERTGCVVCVAVDGPVRGNWDRDALEQITYNLVSNAIRYGAAKPVLVALAQEEGQGILRVRDFGIGIPAADRARIFEPFERALRPGDSPGFGLGLWIARQYARAHGGDIEVDTAPGAGSLFTLRLPGASPE
jgi:signal transduction histidine kinase